MAEQGVNGTQAMEVVQRIRDASADLNRNLERALREGLEATQAALRGEMQTITGNVESIRAETAAVVTGLRADTDAARAVLEEITNAGRDLRAHTVTEFEKSQKLTQDMREAYSTQFKAFEEASKLKIVQIEQLLGQHLQQIAAKLAEVETTAQQAAQRAAQQTQATTTTQQFDLSPVRSRAADPLQPPSLDPWGLGGARAAGPGAQSHISGLVTKQDLEAKTLDDAMPRDKFILWREKLEASLELNGWKGVVQMFERIRRGNVEATFDRAHAIAMHLFGFL